MRRKARRATAPYASCGDDQHDKLVSMIDQLWLQAKTASESVSSLSGATRSCFSAMFLMR
jgi:hypothetical protein